MNYRKKLIFIAILAILIIPTVSQAISRQPWYNRVLVLPENTACNSTTFNGGAKRYSRMVLGMYAEDPVWVMIYYGNRFIRENIRAKSKVTFNFVNKDGFEIEICRKNFNRLRKHQTQEARIKGGAKIPPEQRLPPPNPDELKEIKVIVNSN